MAPHPDDAPSKPETIVAYAGAAFATLVWVGCVIPGATLASPVGDDEAATPLGRGAIYLLPALFLYVTGSVGTTLAAGSTALRAALAAGDGFVTLYVAGALSFARNTGQGTGFFKDPGLVTIVVLLLVVGALSLKEAIRVLTNGGDADAEGPVASRPAGRWADLRLALSILVLVAPASLLSKPDSERASLLAPFVYVAISSGGARLARTTRGLRMTAALLTALLAAHLVVAIRFVLDGGDPPVARVTPVGHATVAVAGIVLLLTLARVALLLGRRREAVA